MDDNLTLMLEMQLRLQKEKMKDGDPQQLEGEAMATFVTWNAWACSDELHEALQEVGWKPWVSSRHINQPSFNREMVDAFHFFMNLLLIANPGLTPAEIAMEFTKLYIAKNAVNAARMDAGDYDGIAGKCPWCHRDLGDAEAAGETLYDAEDGKTYCNGDHALHKLGRMTDAE